MNRLNKPESPFLYCRFSLFLKDPFFSDYLECSSEPVVVRLLFVVAPIEFGSFMFFTTEFVGYIFVSFLLKQSFYRGRDLESWPRGYKFNLFYAQLSSLRNLFC